jgi:Domain of unknown function (DUF5916)/Carbohydrate family 9 binding domain-like
LVVLLVLALTVALRPGSAVAQARMRPEQVRPEDAAKSRDSTSPGGGSAGQDAKAPPQTSIPPPQPVTSQTQASQPLAPALGPPALTIPRLTRAPALENFLSMKPEGEVAQQMAKVTGFVQRDPHDGEKVSEPTDAYLGYDQKNLYVIFVCFDDPRKVRGRMSRREDVHDDDQVEIILDTFHDRRRAYAFQTTPLGVQWDAIWTETASAEVGNWDTSFDTVWDSRGRLTSQGYVASISIPFKSLRFRASKQQEWGIILYRGIVRKNEEAFWPAISRRVQGRLGQAATLYGLEGISPGHSIELLPYGILRGFRALDTRDPDNPFFQNATAQGQFGMDAKFVIHDHFVLDLTANPDFSQVESDDPQITVNQRFEVYFPEKRPFFLENEDYFRTPINLFFTRNVQDPSAGIRLTGKEGPYSVGLMAADDRSPGLAVPAYCPALDTTCASNLYGIRSYFAIARVSRDIFRESSVGALFTDWQCPTTGEFNRVGGVDTHLKFSNTWTLDGQAVVSSSNLQGLNTTNLSTTCEAGLFPFSSGNAGNGNYYAGPADAVTLRRSGLHFNLYGTYQDVSPGFVTVPGFVNRVDIRYAGEWASYYFRPKKGWVVAWGPRILNRTVFDHEGNRLDTDYLPSLLIQGRGKTSVTLFPYEELRERLRPQDFAFLGFGSLPSRDYHEHSSYAAIQSSYFSRVTLGAAYRWGDGVNFVASPTAPSPLPDMPFLARVDTGTAILTLRPVQPLKIENTYLYERLRATEATYLLAQTATPGVGKGIFDNHIVRSKWNWQFTPQLSLRMIFQYNSVLANTPSNTILCSSPRPCPYTYLPTEKQFNADVLVTYLIHPGTAIYVGYNSDLQNLDVVPGTPTSTGYVVNTAKGYLNDSRQFFVKASYQFRF